MIDAIFVSPTVHLVTGTLVLIAGLLALVATGRAAWRKWPFSRGVHALFILFQIALMVQALIGVKLLDQGLGPLQLYIHYVGGLAPLGFVSLFYWFPGTDSVSKSRRAVLVTALSFVFVLMTFAVGSMYVAGTA
ncbi:MAG: hypothetical protein DCC57_00975 [Chloroflexi bacterium]|nr:MAG: hypothetical protein DCC57_00975 [Chloroflexota bacterium]